jgi:uncharacterized protein (DUF2336 family)
MARMTNTTFMDVQRLIQEPSAQTRGLLASKLAADFRSGQFTGTESAIAEEIFRLLLNDSEIQIRAAIARELAHCPHAPHDIVLHLASDESTVALPLLEHSLVLDEDDLARIIRSTREILRLCAIARRSTLSEGIASALVETGYADVLKDLFNNPGAALETTLLQRWQAIPFTPILLEALVNRGGLPTTIVEKLYHAVSDTLRQQLCARYPAQTPLLTKAAQDAREWQLLGITPPEGMAGYDEDLAEDFIDDLYVRGRLTHSLLMRALCVGNLAVFEIGIARLADVPRINARILILESSGRGLQAIYKASGMPEGFFEAVQALLRISLEETGCGQTRPDDFRKRLVERIYAARYNRTIENMEYLLSIIGSHHTTDRAAAHVQ